MKTYLAIYLGTAASMKKWMGLNRKTREAREAAGIAGWMTWAMKNKKSIVDMGAPLGTTKRIGKRGISNVRNELGAYTVVRAKSHAAAAKLFRKHPHFMLFPGDCVEVMECLPLPKM